MPTVLEHTQSLKLINQLRIKNKKTILKDEKQAYQITHIVIVTIYTHIFVHNITLSAYMFLNFENFEFHSFA